VNNFNSCRKALVLVLQKWWKYLDGQAQWLG